METTEGRGRWWCFESLVDAMTHRDMPPVSKIATVLRVAGYGHVRREGVGPGSSIKTRKDEHLLESGVLDPFGELFEVARPL